MRMSKQANMLSLPVRSSSKYVYPDFINGTGAKSEKPYLIMTAIC